MTTHDRDSLKAKLAAAEYASRLAAEVPLLCPRKVDGDCQACKDGIEERAAIIQADLRGWHAREEADRLARQQAVQAMRMGDQRELFG
jgi:hypothetical protein